VVRKLKKVPLVLDASKNDIANTYLRFKNSVVLDSAGLTPGEAMFERGGGAILTVTLALTMP
jgi:hypothetical protein